MMLAVVRPDSWNFPLYLHVAGAMVLVASLIVATYSLRLARTRGDQPATQFAYRVLWRAVLPAYVVMRVGAQWIESKEKPDEEAAWIGIGYITTDAGLLLLIAGLVLGGLAAKKAKAGTSVAGANSLRVAAALTSILIVAYIAAIWAMTTKPA